MLLFTKTTISTIANVLILVQICFGHDQKDNDQTYTNGGYERRVNYACEGSTLVAGCEDGKVISFLRGNYGRANAVTCSHDNEVGWECRSNSSEEVLREMCDGKRSCIIEASQEIFDDPCPGTYKYLEMQYHCEPGESTEEDIPLVVTNQENERQVVYACESTTIRASCMEGQMIEVLRGKYGRSDEPTCHQNEEWYCNEEKAEILMKESCDGKRSCGIEVSNDVFGDPCPYKLKYLEMEYQCIPVLEISPETVSTIAPKSPLITTAPEDPATAPPNTVAPEDPSTVQPETITPTELSKCNQYDLDCLGFKCPGSTGSFNHPTNMNMFVSCKDWKPSNNVCRNGFVFQQEFGKCFEDNSLNNFNNKNQIPSFNWKQPGSNNQIPSFNWKQPGSGSNNQIPSLDWKPEFNKPGSNNQIPSFNWKQPGSGSNNQIPPFNWKP